MAIDPYDLKATDPGLVSGGLMRPKYTSQFKKAFAKTGMINFDDSQRPGYSEGGRDPESNTKSYAEMSIGELEAAYDQAVSNKGFFDATNSKLGEGVVSTLGDIAGYAAKTAAPFGMMAQGFLGLAGWANNRAISEIPGVLADRYDPLGEIGGGWSYDPPAATGAPVDLSATQPSFRGNTLGGGWGSDTGGGAGGGLGGGMSFGGGGSVDLGGVSPSFGGGGSVGLGRDTDGGMGGVGGGGGYGGNSTGGDPAGGHPGGADHGMSDNSYG